MTDKLAAITEELWPNELRGLATDVRRNFVKNYVENGGNGKAAYAAADPGNRFPIERASQILREPEIQAAVLAYSRSFLRGLAPLAVNGLKSLLENPGHADHLKAIRTVLERSDQVIAKSEVSVAVTMTADENSLALLKYLLSVGAGPAALQAALGASLPRYMAMLEPPKPSAEVDAIEGEFAVVECEARAPWSPQGDMVEPAIEAPEPAAALHTAEEHKPVETPSAVALHTCPRCRVNHAGNKKSCDACSAKQAEAKRIARASNVDW
jgi:hypothetical protein